MKALTMGDDIKKLTRRQYEALVLMTGGATNAEAADALGITLRAFKKRRARVNKKFGTTNLAQITMIALRKKLISLH